MGATITHVIKPKDLAPKMAKLGNRYLKAYVSGARNAAHKIVNQLRSASRNVRDQGGYQDGWTFDQSVDTITIYNRSPHALFVELGRRAGAKFPPPQPIIDWVKRNLHGGHVNRNRKGRYIPASKRGQANADKQVRAIAFLVARAIAERGIKGRPLLLSPAQFMKNVQTYRREVDKALTKAMETK